MTEGELQIHQLLIPRKFNSGKANRKKLLQLKVIYLYSTNTSTFEGHACVGEKCCSSYKGAGEQFEALQSKYWSPTRQCQAW